MSRQKHFYDMRKTAGLCVRCPDPPNPAIEGKTQCQSCLDAQRLKTVIWQYELKAGMFEAYGKVCVRCGATDDLHFHHLHGDGAVHRKKVTGDDQGGFVESVARLAKAWISPGDRNPMSSVSRARASSHCSHVNTMPGWNNVPATRVAMAIRSLWP